MTKNSKFYRLLSAVLSLMLVAAMALSMTACSSDNQESPEPNSGEYNTLIDVVNSDSTDEASQNEKEQAFTFIVKDADGKETPFNLTSTEKTVGAALLKEGLIDGEDSAYGLYVKKVNGITADYDTDKAYWAFYINGEMANTGVDSTDIEAGATYSFVYTK